MKKRIGQKVIVIIGLILISTQIIYPLNTKAADKLNWDNPNQGKNPYKFKLSDYLNSQMAMQIVGCTGIVNKVSGTLANLMSGNVSDIKWIWAGKKEKALEQMCLKMNLAIATGLSTVINTTLSNTPKTVAEYCATKKTADKELEKLAKDSLNVEKGNQFREECLNGIAYTLAKNQLTAMTKQTMNWVTSGFNGDPMYVRNINSFMNSIENELIYAELDMFKDLQGNYDTARYPYARDFSSSFINSRQSALNFADSSQQDLTNYLTDGVTIEEYANDFSKGGWYGWLGLTQHSQNNPLGFTMMASQNTADKQAKEIENTKNEIEQGDGLLSQKKCVVKAVTKKAGQIEIEKTKAANTVRDAQNKLDEAEHYYEEAGGNGNDIEDLQDAAENVAIAREELDHAIANSTALDASIEDMTNQDECAEWEVVTPGSLIQDKVSNYLGSPERQLEIADSINDVLNVLFAKLIDKLRLDGLSSLNSESFNNGSGGFGSNSWTTPVDFTDVDGNKYAGSGFDENRAFDLTKDLGNIYNHSDTTKLGTWDAKNNITTGIDGKKGYLVPFKGQTNSYYVVSTAGNTKLFEDNYSVWGIGDRAFFDGTAWQNWKKGETSPTAKRGIIQIQKDYIVVAKELQKIMPAVMPALGELDYCIPGPNPNWQANSANAYEAFTEYVGGLEAIFIPGSDFLKRDAVNITEPTENQTGAVYKNYRDIFPNSWDSGWTTWSWVQNTKIISYMRVLANSGGDWKGKGAAEAEEEVMELIQNIFDSLDIFNEEYPKTINETYGTIQKEFLEYEGTFIHSVLKEKNPAYIPMAKDGLTLTKKMISYDEEIIDANTELKEAINEADSVISKLGLIKSQVGKIIKDAQDRRDKTITEALNAEPYNENYGTNYTLYKTKYAECLNEENIDYLDIEDMLVKEENRCGDRIDNDFDGLIDEKDPDCAENTDRTRTSGGSGAVGNPSSDRYRDGGNIYKIQ